MSATLRELAERFDCALHGPGEARVDRVGTLTGAGPDALAFLANPHYRPQLAATRAGAVVLEEQYRAECPVPALVSANPYAAYARIAAWLHAAPAPTPGIHPSAVVAADARIDPTAEVAAQAVVGAGSVVEESAVVGPGCVLGARVRIGAGSRLAARVTVLDGVEIGRRCILHPGVVIGADGFGFAEDRGTRVKVPQLGGVVIGADVEIGANTTIDRGAIDDTVIEDGVKIDNLVQIAHNVRVGAHSVVCGTAAIAGSTRIGRRCVLAGGVGIIGHLDICDDAVFLVRCLVTHSVSTPGVYSGSLPADEAARWRRNASRFKHLDDYAQRLRALERRGARSAEGGEAADAPRDAAPDKKRD
jgi:UDP-3-O-[3-hydroxymyristoyl] glucosamine N-acyltransferase